VREVLVERKGLGDPVLEHDHEAQAVHGAVLLVMVTAEVGEGSLLVFGHGAVQARHGAAVEQLARPHRHLVVALIQSHRDRLQDHVVGGQHVGEADAAEVLDRLGSP